MIFFEKSTSIIKGKHIGLPLLWAIHCYRAYFARHGCSRLFFPSPHPALLPCGLCLSESGFTGLYDFQDFSVYFLLPVFCVFFLVLRICQNQDLQDYMIFRIFQFIFCFQCFVRSTPTKKNEK